MQLTARQATLLHGWMRARPFLTWDDVVQTRLTLDNLIDAGCRARDVVTMQPNARLWAVHAGANIVHARWMLQAWPAHPLRDLGADLGDMLSHKFTAAELVQMGVTHGDLVRAGMTARFEGMFKFAEWEWELLGRAA